MDRRLFLLTRDHSGIASFSAPTTLDLVIKRVLAEYDVCGIKIFLHFGGNLTDRPFRVRRSSLEG